MRIAIISDAVFPTPMDGGHGLGRMVSQIAEGLLARGHDITLFAKPGSRFSGLLVMPMDADGYEGEKALAREAMRVHRDIPFDVILDHSHLHFLAELFPDLPTVNVYHDCFQSYARCPVLLSRGQRALMPPAFENAWIIPNSLNPSDFAPSYAPNPSPYALFLGAIAELKQPLLAVEACAKAGVKLVLAGQPSGVVLPISLSNTCEWIGTVVGAARDAVLRGARVFLQLGYVESFGLTTLEAGLLGTPIVAWAAGGAVDLVQDGVNGVFVCSTGRNPVEATAEAIERAWWLDRQRVHQYTAGLCDNERQLDAYEEACARTARGEWW